MEFDEIIEAIKPLSLYEKTDIIKAISEMISKEHFENSLDLWDRSNKEEDEAWDDF